ncbi:hypothetical protein THIOKS13320008 [Thiocapsa sp. KS1]|nr:hypothetical protein THIOKS13320008 [Thiocapsa sp. KS1]
MIARGSFGEPLCLCRAFLPRPSWALLGARVAGTSFVALLARLLLHTLLAVSVRLQKRVAGDVEGLLHLLGIEGIEAFREGLAKLFEVSHGAFRYELVMHREVDRLSRCLDSGTAREARGSNVPGATSAGRTVSPAGQCFMLDAQVETVVI